MNRLALFTILASPTVAASWMLLPRYYSSLFGPSLFDTVFMTPSLLPSSGTMVPKVTEPTSLWNQLMDESNQMQQRIMSLSTMSPSYEYKNYDTNITIRTHLPPSMTFENVQVQYDEPNQLLWIRGSNHDEQMNTKNDDSTTKAQSTQNEKKEVSTPTMKSVSHYEFSQTFALDPSIVNVEHLTARYDENNVLTVVVPKYEHVDEANPKPAIRSIPITTTTTGHAAAAITTNESTMNTTTASTTAEVKEPAMTH